MEYLATLESTFKELADKLRKLEETLHTSTTKQQKLRDSLEELQQKIERGEKLI